MSLSTSEGQNRWWTSGIIFSIRFPNPSLAAYISTTLLYGRNETTHRAVPQKSYYLPAKIVLLFFPATLQFERRGTLCFKRFDCGSGTPETGAICRWDGLCIRVHSIQLQSRTNWSFDSFEVLEGPIFDVERCGNYRCSYFCSRCCKAISWIK